MLDSMAHSCLAVCDLPYKLMDGLGLKGTGQFHTFWYSLFKKKLFKTF